MPTHKAPVTEPELKEIYKDSEVVLMERLIPLEDSTDNYRTVIMKIGDMQFVFEFAFNKLIHTWQKKLTHE